jgi:hypothetical protein
MRARALAIVWLLAWTACERDRDRAPEPRSPDCDLVLRDPSNAAARLSQQYRGAPVKVAAIIEECIAPSGSLCERLAKIVPALPGLMPAGAPAVTPPPQVAEVCAHMPPEMQRCMLPSYALAHGDECAKVREAIMAGAKATP